MKEFDDFDMTVTCEEFYIEEDYESLYEGLYEWEESLPESYPEPKDKEMDLEYQFGLWEFHQDR